MASKRPAEAEELLVGLWLETDTGSRVTPVRIPAAPVLSVEELWECTPLQIAIHGIYHKRYYRLTLSAIEEATDEDVNSLREQFMEAAEATVDDAQYEVPEHVTKLTGYWHTWATSSSGDEGIMPTGMERVIVAHIPLE